MTRRDAGLLLTVLLTLPPVARAQSGTAWAPAAAPQHGVALRAAGWQLMIHGNVFGQFIREAGPRGNWQLGSVNWLMTRADHALAGGTLGLRAMVSGEFLTITRAGYPELLQVAQPYRGNTLTDRMHPHELFSEAAVSYEHGIVAPLSMSLYLAAAGEPALGPVAYLHRPSAEYDPIAPLTHHALDETHERFGVATVGVFTSRVRLEASAFNGAHPDDVHTNFELAGARLNSFSSRIALAPAPEWSASASAAYIAASARAADHAHGALHRFILSIGNVQSRGERLWASTLVWGADAPIGTGRVLHSVLLESSLEWNARRALFSRIEYASRTAEDLNLVGSVSEQLAVGAAVVGYARRMTAWRAITVWLGGRGTAYLLPAELRVFYGARTLTGFAAYVELRPPLMHEHAVVSDDAPHVHHEAHPSHGGNVP